MCEKELLNRFLAIVNGIDVNLRKVEQTKIQPEEGCRYLSAARKSVTDIRQQIELNRAENDVIAGHID